LVFKVQLMLIAQLIVVIGVIRVQTRSRTIDGLAVLVEVLAP
jgi:spore maturation protein SpmA